MSNEALLIMDLQNGIVDRVASDAPRLLVVLGQALNAARRNGRLVIFVRVAFRSGAPEISANNQSFSQLAGSTMMDEDAPSTQIHSSLEPIEGELIVTKRRVSAFSGSDLEVILRANKIDSLVLSGIATSGVVLSTLRQAADLDYRITVLEDACADGDEEVHRVLTQKVFPRQASVMSTQAWITSLAD
jgi:nicotinamidase-related amidase